MISEEDINMARKDLTKYGVEWRKRKRSCLDILDAICESADLNRKDFIVKTQISNYKFRINLDWRFMKILKLMFWTICLESKMYLLFMILKLTIHFKHSDKKLFLKFMKFNY